MDSFISATASLNGIQLHHMRGGTGPAVILVHGFPQDWAEYRPIMPRLAERFTVVAVDLRGIGASTGTDGFDAMTLADDIYALATKLGLERPYLVGHDLGGLVVHAFIRKHPDAARGAMILDQALLGVPGTESIEGDPRVWHGPFMQLPDFPEKMITGKQAEFFGYFLGFGKFTPDEIAHFVAAHTSPAQIHAVLGMYRAMPATKEWNAAQKAPNATPLFVGTGDKSPFVGILAAMAQGLRDTGFANVETGTIAGAIHYVVADQPAAVAALIERHAEVVL